VTTFDLLRDLFATHPSYGAGRAGKLEVGPAPPEAVRRTVGDWYASAGEVFQVDSSFLLDGRRLICALAYLDESTCRLLTPDDLLAAIEREIDGLERELSEHGRELRDRCHGRGGELQVTSRTLDPMAAARQSRLQVLVHDEKAPGRFLLLPRDAQVLEHDPSTLSVAKAVAMAAARHDRPPSQSGGADPLPIGIFDVADAAPQWPTFGIAVVWPGATTTTTSEAADAARTIVVQAPFPGDADLDLTQEQLLALYTAGRMACREFLDGWDFERWLATFRPGSPPVVA
jgi:hypothetical protein